MSAKYVLILLTNRVEREVMKGMLHGEGYRVFDTDSAQAARRIMRRFPVDVVVVGRSRQADESVPFLAYCQVRHPRVARVLTAHAPQSPEGLRSLALGRAHALLLKPIVEAELLFCVGRALGKSRLEPEAVESELVPTPLVGFFSRLQQGRA